MKASKTFFSLAFVFVSLVSPYLATNVNAQQAAPEIAVAEYQIGAVLYMQKAAEYRALAYQAFNLAKMNLDADFDKKNLKKLPKDERKRPRAVVVDVDETVLDNSPAQAMQIKNNLPYIQENWTKWVELRKAKPIPGSVDFLNYAASKGVRIFYVTNRNEAEKAATIDNLKTAGFPDVSAETVLVRGSESGKEARRQTILQKHRIVLLIGDNLNDLSNVFERKSVADRLAEVDKTRQMFGAKYIVLPNAMYGDWESAIYEYQRLTEREKAAKRAAALEMP